MIPSQSFQIIEPVSYYVGSKSTQAAILQSSAQSVKVVQASQGLAIFSSSGSFSGFIKLTQSIEMVLYFNLLKPQNYEVFLRYFSQNIFSVTYNPMEDIFNEDCTLPWAFKDNDFSCSFIENTGGNFLIFGILVVLKLIIIGGLKGFKDKPKPLRIFKFCDEIISLNLLMVLVDALMFDFIVAALVSFKTSNLSSPTSIIDFLLSVAVLGFYLLEMVFIFFYCKAMYSIKDHSKLMPQNLGEENQNFL